MSYAIMRVEPIITIEDLAQIGSHNKREKKSYRSNPDIKIELSPNNIELVPLESKYVKGFYELTKEYKKEHEERMKTEREDRQRTYHQMLNKSRNVVADELVFTATNDFFKDMSNEEVEEWGKTCMEFVYNDMGYTREQVLHATIHMDEKTPHVHCVVVPLVKKYDKRTKTERYTISKKQYIRDKIHLSELQDKYHKRLTDKGYDLERGIKGSDSKHIKIKDFKKLTKRLENDLNIRNVKLNKALEDFNANMQTNKNIPFDKNHIVVDKETINSMNNVVKETQKAMKVQEKLEKVFDEIDDYIVGYKMLEKENSKYSREILALENKNYELEQENNKLRKFISDIIERIKKYFRNILKFGSERDKDTTVDEIEDFYDNDNFNESDVMNIVENTSKEDELLDYINYSKDREDDFDMSI